ncbi:MAG: hypothetical protein R3A44_06275 [Caldilineaceae bacterium]
MQIQATCKKSQDSLRILERLEDIDELKPAQVRIVFNNRSAEDRVLLCFCQGKARRLINENRVKKGLREKVIIQRVKRSSNGRTIKSKVLIDACRPPSSISDARSQSHSRRLSESESNERVDKWAAVLN